MTKFQQYINESSLSRIWQYIENEKDSFAVISAYRGENTKNENQERHKQLKIMVRKYGYGYIEMKGGYKEDIGFVSEMSLFIPKIKKVEAITFGIEFEQNGILYKDNNGFYEIGTNKSTGVGKINAKFMKHAGKENLNLAKEVIKEFFSSLLKGSHRGKKFVFQLQEMTYVGHLSRMSGKKPKWIIII